MKVYIDVSVMTLATFVTGIQRVTREVVLRLMDCGDLEVVLLHYNARENQYHRIDNRKFLMFYRSHEGIKERMIMKQSVPLSEFREGDVIFEVDAVWMCRVKRSYLYPILKERGVRIVPFIHDIISVEYPAFCLERGVYNFMDYICAALLYGDTLVTTTHAVEGTLHSLTERLGIPMTECRVVPLGADFSGNQAGEIVRMNTPEEVRAAVESAPYLLMVGTIEPRKNHMLLLDAYECGLKEMGYHIIMAGYLGWNMEAFAERLHTHPDYGTGIFHFEGLGDDAITYLYRHARFLAFLSYTEGFGLPIIESMLRGTPVLAADVPVFREVGEGRCVWFPQDDAAALCQCVKRYQGNETAYRELKDSLTSFRPMSWEESGRRIGEILTGKAKGDLDGAKGTDGEAAGNACSA